MGTSKTATARALLDPEIKKEAEKIGRLPNIQEMLLLLEAYKEQNDDVSRDDEEFLGIEELSYDEDVYLEWIECLDDIAFLRGGYWYNGAAAGVFVLSLHLSPADLDSNIGFRCAR